MFTTTNRLAWIRFFCSERAIEKLTSKLAVMKGDAASSVSELEQLRQLIAVLKADANAATLELEQSRSCEQKLREELRERCVPHKAGDLEARLSI